VRRTAKKHAEGRCKRFAMRIMEACGQFTLGRTALRCGYRWMPQVTVGDARDESEDEVKARCG